MKRLEATVAAERNYYVEKDKDQPVSTYFGEDTFNQKIMQEKLPKATFKKLLSIIDENSTLDMETANEVAHAMKEWAIEKGATHFAHWFQPMTGATAEKHDAFIEFSGTHEVLERFSGKQLVQGEPDASSFPSGGIRATFEARGYTAWDISSPAFLRRNGIGTTLCIPTAFISYTGEALDKKTPLLRSIRAVNQSALKILKLLGNTTSTKIVSNLGPEQEYFLIDKDYYFKRQDLVLTGRTVVGAPPAKGQELDDQYFGSIKERVQSFMHDVEEELYKLGIPAKTRHNEVAPSQFEIAPIFEEANIAVDHNQLVMDRLTAIAKEHDLACLLNEKPFARINGSGKHMNWSLSTNDGINLLNPGETPHENIQFLVFLTATIKAVYKHADILRASVASSGNDHRLGANEAPPAIISIFLGEQLTEIVENIVAGKVTAASEKAIIDLGISTIPALSKDTTDRNRTSPFAFTGNKFEFRAVGSSQTIAFPATVLNTIVAESLDEIAAQIEANGKDDKSIIEIIQKELKEAQPVLFIGDNYSEDWHKEAEKRGLPNNRTTPSALPALITDKAKKVFSAYNVLSEVELQSRYNVYLEKYATDIDIEAKALYNLISTTIIPSGISYQSELAESIDNVKEVVGSDVDLSPQIDLLKQVSALVSKILTAKNEIKDLSEKAHDAGSEQACADSFCDVVKAKMEEVREDIDELETLVDDELWSLPKFWEMLFIN